MQKDRAIGLGFSAIGVLMLIFSKSIVVLDNLSEPGPRLFPIVVAIGLIVCGLGVFFESAKKDKAEQKEHSGEGKKLVVKRYSLNALALILYLVGLWLFGFLIATPFGMLGFIYALANDKKVPLWKAIILSVVTTGLVYLCFTWAFQLQLPSGLVFRG